MHMTPVANECTRRGCDRPTDQHNGGDGMKKLLLLAAVAVAGAAALGGKDLKRYLRMRSM
jgi:hypothetical protein